MSSWLGACMIAGCAIGATGIVIHHYSSSAYQIPPKITYMINEEEWVKGVVEEFNNKVEELNEGEVNIFLATDKVDEYGKLEKAIDGVNYKDHPHKHRSKCVSMMADAYRETTEDQVKQGIKYVLDHCPNVERKSPVAV